MVIALFTKVKSTPHYLHPQNLSVAHPATISQVNIRMES